MSGSGSGASLSKYKERISLYEDPENPLAPLTSTQLDFLLELTHGDFQRPIPAHLAPLPEAETVNVKEPIPDVNWDKFEFKSKAEFNNWFVEVDKILEKESESEVVGYMESLEGLKGQTKSLMEEVGGALDELKTLQDNYHFVSNKTNSLHDSCQQLIHEQSRLESVSQSLDANLSHFVKLERIASKLSSGNLLVASDSFFVLLEQIDACLSFMVHNPSFKESSTYGAKYRHCLNKAISLMKSHVKRTLEETTAEIRDSVREIPSKNSPLDTTHLFPLVYGKFSAGIAKLKKLLVQVEERRNATPEYGELYGEIQESYFRERKVLVGESVGGMVEEVGRRGRTGTDLCPTVRLAATFSIRLSQDEFRLYADFFSPQITTHFDGFMESLLSPIYDTLRPLLIKVQHLETLAELCNIFGVEMMEERQATGSPLGLNAFLRFLEQLLQDTQERLVYRASIYIATDIRNYSPGPGDLAYPDKLLMMEEIAESLDAEGRLFRRSNSQSSITSITSLEVANINAHPLQIPRPLKAASSPADLHGMWYPSVRRTLLCLSKLSRSLEKGIFQGLSQEALSACITNLSSAAEAIAQRKTIVDAQLFEIKHLLILREQIAPFQVEFAVRETTLDFSRVKIAALSLLQKKKQLFSLSGTNALLEFIVEGTPQVKEYFLDSKKDVDRQLKTICELFITHATNLLIGPINSFLQKAKRVGEAAKEKPELRLRDQSFAVPTVVAGLIQESLDSLKTKLPFLYRSMRLYLANRETEFILFRPIKNNVLNGFLEVENVVSWGLEGSIGVPSQEHLSALLSSIHIQSS